MGCLVAVLFRRNLSVCANTDAKHASCTCHVDLTFLYYRTAVLLSPRYNQYVRQIKAGNC